MVCVGGSVAVSGVLRDAPLLTPQALRYAAAVVLLLLVARLRGQPIVRPHGREWAWLGGIAATGLVLFNVALVHGSAHAEPAVLGVAVASVPVLLALLGPGRRGTVVVAAVVVSVGAALVQDGGRTDLAGLGWALVVLLCEAAFTLLAVPVLGRHGPWGVSVHTCWIAAVLLAVGGVVVEGPGVLTRLTGAHLAAIGYLALFVTALAFVLWYSAVRTLGAGRAGLLTGIAPIAAALVGALLGAPLPGPVAWTGIALVGAGLAVGMGRRTRGRSRAPHPSVVGATPV
jgi:drug/metabolite transporter (DMT)-like permease